MATPLKKDLSVHRLADGIRTASGRDGGTVLDIGENRIYRLNALGDLILRWVRQGWNEGMIATQISNQYSISKDQASSDVQEFLKLLNEHRLIQAARRPEEP